jgi:hypothetical protein
MILLLNHTLYTGILYINDWLLKIKPTSHNKVISNELRAYNIRKEKTIPINPLTSHKLNAINVGIEIEK